MKFGGLSWRLLGGIALVVILALGASFWLFTSELERLRDEELTGQLLAEGRLLRSALDEGWAARDARPIAGMVNALHNEGTDVIAIVTDGTVLVNTTGATVVGADLLGQPETRQALAYGSGEATRGGIHGPTPTRVVAVRVGSDADELGVVWLARPRWTFVTHARSFGRAFALVGVIALAAILGLGITMTRRWATLLRRMTSVARSLAEGDLSARTEVRGADEFARLAHSLNEMRRRQLTQVEMIDRQRRTLESLLHQLQEGVVAADGDGRIILINPAALRLLNSGPGDPTDRSFMNQAIERCLPQHELQRLLRPATGTPTTGAPTTGAPTSGRPSDAVQGPSGALDDARPPAAQERHLRIETSAGTVHVLARAADIRLPDATQQTSDTAAGRLLVLTDVTALHRALQMQTDFVANASHELRTPLSSIRAAVETLLQMDLAQGSAEAGRFLDVIDRQSARLVAMASDLLDLSRIQSPTAPGEATALQPDEVLRDLTERFAEGLRAQGLHWQTDWEPSERQTFLANRHLLRLVLDNLVDNAIQFTEPGGHVRVVCRTAAGHVIFEVTDDGCGIPAADQERVFERFYQVERARSGPRRGTGLGLSIVRDAATALGGTVQLWSEVGRGTRVAVTLPQTV